MTSIPVSNAKSLVMDLAVQTPAKDSKVGEKSGFTDVLSKQTEETGKVQETDDAAKDVEEKAGPKNPVKDVKNHAVREKTEKVKEPAEDSGDFEEMISDAGKEVAEQIAKELGVSVDAVLKAMEVLNLTVIDLLNPENLVPLLLETSGETDPMAVLTDGDFSQILKRLDQFVDDIRTELETAFEIPKEELNKVLEETKKILPGDMQHITETEKEPVILVENQEEKPVHEKEEPVRNPENGFKNEFRQEISGPEKTDTQTGRDTGEKSPSGHPQSEENFVFTNLLQKAGETVTDSRPVSFVSQPDTQQVMNQIMDFMKIQIKPDTTQLEMHLHPESLGNVQVHISAKEGVVTAQFAAQNETVKTILESQIVELRENLINQGVKVEAIEVSVQANGFRQEYEENRGDGNGEPREKKKARRISLNRSLMEDMENLSEEEQMKVSMMEANGNTVDYTA